MDNVFERCDLRLSAEGEYFQRVLNTDCENVILTELLWNERVEPCLQARIAAGAALPAVAPDGLRKDGCEFFT
jgi:hypothetical protein